MIEVLVFKVFLEIVVEEETIVIVSSNEELSLTEYIEDIFGSLELSADMIVELSESSSSSSSTEVVVTEAMLVMEI